MPNTNSNTPTLKKLPFTSNLNDVRFMSDRVFSPLGNDTKSHVVLENKGGDCPTTFQVEKLALQDVACSILNERELVKRDGYEFYKYEWRVNYCLKQRVNCDDDIEVRYNQERRKSHYHNLQRCGSVWTCPYCAMQITEGRRNELKSATAEWRKRGGYVYMMTLTNRHHIFDSLDDLLKGQIKSTKRFWESKKARGLLGKYGYFGRITALEVTHGVNGWHPHYHILLFVEHQIDIFALQNELASIWQSSCVKSGLKAPSLEHGLNIQDGSKADEYIAKFGLSDNVGHLECGCKHGSVSTKSRWDVESEMTKGHVKKGLKDSVTPFDMLRLAESEPKYRELFREFAVAFKGRRQLVWSAGLKKALGIVVVTDEQLAKETEQNSIKITSIPKEFWRLLLRYKSRGEYLFAVENDYLYGGSSADDLIWRLGLLEAERIRRSLERGGQGGGLALSFASIAIVT